jgi:CheY-like chemotaxis protein
MKYEKQSLPLRIMLADDDRDDRFFFEKVLEELPIRSSLETVEDGEQLMSYLIKTPENIPDVLFLDLNMPRINGLECLSQIKGNEKLKQFPVIIYSTSLNVDVVDLLYKNGAHYYLRKTELVELNSNLNYVLTLLIDNKFTRPTRDEFIIDLVKREIKKYI